LHSYAWKNAGFSQGSAMESGHYFTVVRHADGTYTVYDDDKQPRKIRDANIFSR